MLPPKATNYRQSEMKRLNLLTILLLACLEIWAQGTSTDTTNYLLGGSFDNYSAWSFSKQTGTNGTLSNYNGLNGDGLQINYTFPSTGGWVNLEIPIGSAYTNANPLVFFISAANSTDKLEIKFIDSDGSVFDLKPSLGKYSVGWYHVTAYLSNASYDWGGNSTFNTPSRFSIAISGPSASSGTVYLDEIGIGKPGLASSFLPTIDPNSELTGTGFIQRRDLSITPEDPLVLKFLEGLQDYSTIAKNIVPTYLGGAQVQTFNNCLAALSFLVKNERERTERILDFYLNATDSTNTDSLKQNFFYKDVARGFYQECDIHTLKASGAKNRWIGDMAWLLITCKNYQQTYSSSRYDYLIQIIKDLFLSLYKEAAIGGYIQHGWENGDAKLHESFGHPEGNIDCYVALKLCGEDFYAHRIKIWIDDQLNGNTSLPLDLYTWRVLAFGAMGNAYTSLLNIPEYDFRFRKIININGKDVMGMYSNPDITINNFWNDGTGHISCAFQAFGDKQRGFFYANQFDPILVNQTIGTEIVHGIAYTLNTQGYAGVDPKIPVISSSAWYILAKNGCNPFLSDNFIDSNVNSVIPPEIRVNSLRAYPNPFTSLISINFQAINNTPVNLNIYNIYGAKVKTMVITNPLRGNNIATWNGTDSSCHKVESGVYLVQLVTGNYIENTRILYMKNEQ